MSQCKIFVYCPFTQKEEAKQLGAKWDPLNKKWYAPSEDIYQKLKKWHVPANKKPYDRPKVSKKKESEQEYKTRQSCGSYYKGVWGGVPSEEQFSAMKEGQVVMSTAYDTRGD